MNRVEREGDRCLFWMSRRMREAVTAFVDLGRELGRGPTPVSRESADSLPPGAGRDLEEALRAQREEQGRQVAGWLEDGERWRVEGEEEVLRLAVAEVEVALQVVNSIRVGAWERLGRPDFEAGNAPALSAEALPSVWVLQMSDPILFALLSALDAG
ncbi:MAG: hypothetical protein ACKOET_17705 [Verrucomicrobiota bacterium]